MAKSTSRISSSFNDSLKNNLAPLVRYIRESIAAKRVSSKTVRFSIGNEKVSLDLVEGLLRVTTGNGKKKANIFEPELPKLFVKHVKFYVRNMGWSLEEIKKAHQSNSGEFFSSNREILEDSLVCGWRAVSFVTKSSTRANVHVFHPGFYNLIETVDSRQTEEVARRLSEYLAYGECFACNMRQGPNNFCYRHEHIK